MAIPMDGHVSQMMSKIFVKIRTKNFQTPLIRTQGSKLFSYIQSSKTQMLWPIDYLSYE